MSEEETDDDKTHDPTQRKLEDARRKGDLAKSTDLLAFAALAGMLLVGLLLPTVLGDAMVAAQRLLASLPELAVQEAERLSVALTGSLLPMLKVGALAMGLPALFVILMLVAQRGLVFAPDKLKPRLARVSPIANARHKFGPEGLFEFAKGTLKLVLVSMALFLVLQGELDAVVASARLSPVQGISLFWGILGTFFLTVLVVMLFLGVLDLLWQRHVLARRNRMSRKELMDEAKEQEGDPHTRSSRRQRAQDIALNQMLSAVPESTVVIVNPTHVAVALKWSRGAQTAPVVVAKGVDEIALRIRTCAAEAGVPIHSDPPTARAIHATVAIGEPVRNQHFAAVAVAIRFAERLRNKARRSVL